MTQAEPAGLMAFRADIDPDHEARFLEWHNCEHMPERVSVPGFREGRRYRELGSSRRYLMMYFTENADVLGGRAYIFQVRARACPRTWSATRRIASMLRSTSSSVVAHDETLMRIAVRPCPARSPAPAGAVALHAADHFGGAGIVAERDEHLVEHHVVEDHPSRTRAGPPRTAAPGGSCARRAPRRRRGRATRSRPRSRRRACGGSSRA